MNSKFRIPKRFKLLGQTINVVYDDELVHEDDFKGVAVYRRNEIRIQPSNKYQRIPKEQVEQTFLHELIHFILYYTNIREVSEAPYADEAFVDATANLLHQALTTMEY